MIIYEEILRASHTNKIRYVLVGGLALNLQGAFRSTADLDILVDMTDANLAKIVKILKQKKYVVKQPLDPKEGPTNFGWETETDRLKRHMSMPAKRKLELLYELNRFTKKYSVKSPSKFNKRHKKTSTL